MIVFDGQRAELASDEQGDELHRAGTVDRQQSDDVFDAFHLELTAEILHTAGLQLEHRDRVASVQQIECRLILKRYPVEIQIDSPRFLILSSAS